MGYTLFYLVLSPLFLIVCVWGGGGLSSTKLPNLISQKQVANIRAYNLACVPNKLEKIDLLFKTDNLMQLKLYSNSDSVLIIVSFTQASFSG